MAGMEVKEMDKHLSTEATPALATICKKLDEICEAIRDIDSAIVNFQEETIDELAEIKKKIESKGEDKS